MMTDLPQQSGRWTILKRSTANMYGVREGLSLGGDWTCSCDHLDVHLSTKKLLSFTLFKVTWMNENLHRRPLSRAET